MFEHYPCIFCPLKRCAGSKGCPALLNEEVFKSLSLDVLEGRIFKKDNENFKQVHQLSSRSKRRLKKQILRIAG